MDREIRNSGNLCYMKAVSLLKEGHNEMLGWIASMPSFFETNTQIYVHAGVDEDAGEYWKWGTSD